MRFKTDENLSLDVAELLKRQGHDAENVWQELLSGTPDTNLILVCQQERRILLTLDTDFANILAYPPRDYFGIIVFRLANQDKVSVLTVVGKLLKLLETESPEKSLWIVEEGRVRIRKE